MSSMENTNFVYEEDVIYEEDLNRAEVISHAQKLSVYIIYMYIYNIYCLLIMLFS
jgi:hypothetical protein